MNLRQPRFSEQPRKLAVDKAAKENFPRRTFAAAPTFAPCFSIFSKTRSMLALSSATGISPRSIAPLLHCDGSVWLEISQIDQINRLIFAQREKF